MTNVFMRFLQSLPWSDPLDLASDLMQRGDSHWVLLYSGVQASYSGRFSILAYDHARTLQGEDFCVLADKLTQNRERFDNAWFGYLGYGLKDGLEILAHDQPNWLHLPNLYMMQFHTILLFDHVECSVAVWSDRDDPSLPTPVSPAALRTNRVQNLSSNMTKEQYLDHAVTIIDRIRAGDLYQANLTRKFTGNFETKPAPFELFRRLCSVSPSPYSAFIRMGDTYALSSSPELFLHIDANGQIRARPIKGTSARFSDPALDAQSRAMLENSAKDRAENLMIVDLMRNDLSKTCIAGSVRTPALFEVTSHATVHHMSSTVTGTKSPECTTLDAITHCFPPGSMTGAPKIRAMNVCSELELVERGMYSGAVGWLGGDGSCELSVVIRTLLVNGNRFEFQVGGGIVADSVPENEFKEIIDKAKGILECLGICPEEISAL